MRLCHSCKNPLTRHNLVIDSVLEEPWIALCTACFNDYRLRQSLALAQLRQVKFTGTIE